MPDFDFKKPLAEAEMEAANEKYLELSPAERDELFDQLAERFVNLGPADDFAERPGYFRWFTDVTWENLALTSDEFFVQVIAGRQIPTALLLGVDVLSKFLSHIYFRFPVENDAKAFYVKTKDAFLASSAILGRWQGTEYRLADAVREMTLIRSRGRDSIQVASFLDKLKQIIFDKDDRWGQMFFTAEPDEAVDRLVDLIDFFLDVGPDEIFTAVEMHILPEKYKSVSTRATPNKSAAAPAKPIAPPPAQPAPAQKPAPIKPVSPPVAKPSPAKPAAPAKPSYSEIKKKIEERFEKNKEGEFADLDGVFVALQKAAEKYNDPKIAEMLYFDEQTGKFKWNS